MMIVMKRGASRAQIDHVVEWIEGVGYRVHLSEGVERTIIGAVGDERGKEQLRSAIALAGVEQVIPILAPYKLASREFHEDRTVVDVGGVKVGGDDFVVMAGPCSVESEEQILESARIVQGGRRPRAARRRVQAAHLALLVPGHGGRGARAAGPGARTDGPAGRDRGDGHRTGVDLVAEYADLLQIGARNVQNFALLKKVGQAKKPVLLKRGMIDDHRGIAAWPPSTSCRQAIPQVILCERGIRTFETATRNTLDLSAVAVLKDKSHLPVIVDPSHGIGHWRYIAALSRAAYAVGADGIIVEVHPEPEKAVSDGLQSLKPERFRQMMAQIAAMQTALGRVRDFDA